MIGGETGHNGGGGYLQISTLTTPSHLSALYDQIILLALCETAGRMLLLTHNVVTQDYTCVIRP